MYLNRLSDLLFVLARVLARADGGTEVLWDRNRLQLTQAGRRELAGQRRRGRLPISRQRRTACAQSNAGPGSVLRPGAMSLCPTMRRGCSCGYAASNARIASAAADVLRRLVRQLVRAFQFDADGKVIAGLAPLVLRNPGMPGPQLERHELHDLAVAPHQQVRRHTPAMDLRRNTDARRAAGCQ